jgi:hypothetical protein
MRRAWCALQCVALAALAGAQGVSEHVAALGAGDEARSASAWAALLAAPPDDAAAAALSGFAEAPSLARRARARLLAEVCPAGRLPAALALLADTDAAVRRALLPLCARPDLGQRGLGERVAALAERARDDADSTVRDAALATLGELDHEAAVGALATLALELPPPERARAAAALPATPRAAPVIAALVGAGFAGSARTPADVLAALLPLHGRLLADRRGGGESARGRAPLILGLRHPAAEVRAAAAVAFDELLGRLGSLGEASRALRILAGLEEQGLDVRVTHYHRARLALYPGADAASAREAARGLRGAPGSLAAVPDDELTEARLWLFRSLYLEGLAELALGELDGASARLAESGAVLDGLLGERLDLASEELRYRHVDALHQRALVHLALVLCRLAGGAGPEAPELRASAREAHVLSLQAQAHYAALEGEALTGWDALLDSELSPYRLLFTGAGQPAALDAARGLALQAGLGRVLASVSPREAPGFEPVAGDDPAHADPLSDPVRLQLLKDVQMGRLEGVERELERIEARVARGQADPLWVVPEADLAAIETLDLRARWIRRELERGDLEGWDSLMELRIPGSQALWLARDLRADGRGTEARDVAQRFRNDLEAGGLSNWWYYLGQERLARADMTIGSSWTDDDEPRRAEEALVRAVERLEDIERRLVEGGAARSTLAPYRALRATALVSLAVNANVKLGEGERALAFYEEAYRLRQDDFMRVLLACYRARAGRVEEARALLREVRPGPQVFYNMACTHALLGETEVALEWLKRDLEENHGSPGARARQQEWARSDPDLASLRGDPRFEALVGR